MLNNAQPASLQIIDRLIGVPSTHGSMTTLCPARARCAESFIAASRLACRRVSIAPAPSSGLTTQRVISGARSNASGVVMPASASRVSVLRLLDASAMEAASQPSQRAGSMWRWNCASSPSVSGATTQTASCASAWRATNSNAVSKSCGRAGVAGCGTGDARLQVATVT